MASTYGELGNVAYLRRDYGQAARQYQRALDISERLGNQADMARSYHQLGILAQDRRDYGEAARQYQRSLDIRERLGDQAGMARSYHQLGMLAQDRGDYDEAARQYQRALTIFQRLGDQADMARATISSASSPRTAGTTAKPPANTSAPSTSESGSATRPGWPALPPARHASPRTAGTTTRPPANTSAPSTIFQRLGDQADVARSYHQLGILAQNRRDYSEAARQYQRALTIKERLGDQAGMATTYRQLGILEAEQPEGSAATAVGWHVKALAIRLRLGAPQAANDLRRLAAHRQELGPGLFTSLLSEAAGNTELTEAITSLLDQLDTAKTEGA